MNKQEKELKHCTACNQMTNHSGETCLKHTSDTDMDKAELAVFWDEIAQHLPKSIERGALGDEKIYRAFANAYPKIKKHLLSSHTTHWKERVRKEVEGMRKKGNNGEGLPFENSPEIYGNARMEAWKNGHNKALDTLLDNLK